MLSQEAKDMIAYGVNGTLFLAGNVNGLIETGPVQMINETLDVLESEGETVISTSVRENRVEAEKYLAGLLGMM